MTIALLPWQVAPLQDLLARGDKLPHALLLYGQRGIGKVLFARAMAQSLLCETRGERLACGHCAACGWFSQGNHPDFRELIPEVLGADDDSAEDEVGEVGEAVPAAKEKKKSKFITIDQIRNIGDFMTLSTHRDGRRVLLIHPAEALNANAANALLKTLEEPQPRTLILLVTDQMGRLLATLKSRCQRVLLATPPASVAVLWLAEQGVTAPAVALAGAGGAPLAALDFAGSQYQAERLAFLEVLASSEADHLAAAVTFEKSELANIMTWLQTWVADIALAHFTGAVRHHQDHHAAIARVAARVDLPALFRYESQLRAARRAIHHPLNPRLLLEHLLLSYSHATRAMIPA